MDREPAPAHRGPARRELGSGVLIVLPTYNEAVNIVPIMKAIISSLPGAHVLVVDDGSPDGTAELVAEHARHCDEVTLMRRASKLGLGTAYLEGFGWGLERGYSVLCEMDADGSHDPTDLPSLVAPIKNGAAELTIGSRYIPGGAIVQWPLGRQFISRTGNLYANALLKLGVRDATAGYRAYSAPLLHRIKLQSVRATSYAFQIEMTHLARQAKATIREVPIRFTNRREGLSKMSVQTVGEALGLVVTLSLAERVDKGRGRSKDVSSHPKTAAQPGGLLRIDARGNLRSLPARRVAGGETE